MRSHGREADYRAGCRCELCLAADRRARKLRAAGIGNRRPIAPVKALFAKLKAEGWSDMDLAAASGLNVSNVWRIRNGRQQTMTWRRYVDVMSRAYTRKHPGSRIDATPTRRRLQALMWMGWSVTYLAGRTGVDAATISGIVSGEHGTKQRTADAVAAAYDALSMTAGPSNRARYAAQRRGYLPPLAWDDIDDLDEQPDVTVLRRPGTPRALPVDDVAELHAQGLDHYAIAERLGWHHDTIRKAILRMERAS